MAVHFSIGFVAYATPRNAYEALCAVALDRSEVEAVWPREDGMNCDCETVCISNGVICGPRGDDVRVLVSVYDTDGDEFDITGAAEIVMAVSDDKNGQVRFVKRLTAGDMIISTNGYQFAITITDTDTLSLVKTRNYYEIQLTTSAGLKKTISVGLFRSNDTMIKDLP